MKKRQFLVFLILTLSLLIGQVSCLAETETVQGVVGNDGNVIVVKDGQEIPKEDGVIKADVKSGPESNTNSPNAVSGGNGTSITIEGSVSIEHKGESVGVSVEANQSNAVVTVTGNVTAESQPGIQEDNNGNDPGIAEPIEVVFVGESGSSESSNPANGGSGNENMSENQSLGNDEGYSSTATGVSAYSDGQGMNAEINVGGIVKAEANGSEEIPSESIASIAATGVNAVSENGGTTEINVERDVTAEAKGSEEIPSESIAATGVNAVSENGGTTKIDVIGNVTATTDPGASFEDEAKGVDAEANSGTIEIVVEGSINAVGVTEAAGADLVGKGEGDITFKSEDISAVAEAGSAAAARVEARDKSSVTANITDDLKATAPDDSEYEEIYTVAEALVISTVTEGSAEVTVTGNLNATGMNALGIDAINRGGKIIVDVTGNVTAIGDDMAAGIAVKNGSAYQMEEEISSEGSTEIRVTGDVTSNDTGLEVALLSDQDAKVIIDGTLSGENQAVLLTDDAQIGENLTLTVWEVKPNGEGVIAAREDGVGTTQDKEAEKQIQYIIRIAEDSAEHIKTDARQYEDYQVAGEQERVTLKLNIPQGYRLTGVYGDVGKFVQLKTDDKNNYYLDVPRGGGVMLSLTMEKIQDNTGGSAAVSVDAAGESAAVSVAAARQDLAFGQDQVRRVYYQELPYLSEKEDNDETVKLKKMIDDIAESGILSVLRSAYGHEHIEEFVEKGVAEIMTLTLKNYTGQKEVILKLKTENTYTEDVVVVFGVPNAEGGYTYYTVIGTPAGDGSLNISLKGHTASVLAGSTFVAMIFPPIHDL